MPARSRNVRAVCLANSNQQLFTLPAPHSTPVELHWHILDVPYYLRTVPMEWFWEHTEALQVGAPASLVLDPIANLVYLPAHLALHHRLSTLHSFVDLALLVTKHGERLDWEAVAASARSFDLLTAVRETMDRLAALWPALPLEAALSALHTGSAVAHRPAALSLADGREPQHVTACVHDAAVAARLQRQGPLPVDPPVPSACLHAGALSGQGPLAPALLVSVSSCRWLVAICGQVASGPQTRPVGALSALDPTGIGGPPVG